MEKKAKHDHPVDAVASPDVEIAPESGSEPAAIAEKKEAKVVRPQQATVYHANKFKAYWKTDRPWLVGSEESGAMTRTACTFAKTGTSWAKSGCTSIRSDTIQNHESNKVHVQAVRLWQRKDSDAKQLKALVAELTEKDREAMIKRLQVIYFNAKHELANKLFPDTMQLLEVLGTPGLTTSVREYKSSRFASEGLRALSDWVGETFVFGPARDADGFGLMIDETTDVAVHKQLIIYLRLVKNGSVTTRFGGVVRLRDGKAFTVTNALLDWMAAHRLDMNKLFAIATDGASVMTGVKSGVVTRLKHFVPHLLSMHCVAHKLALVVVEANRTVEYLFPRFDMYLTAIWKFFKYSAIKTDAFERMQKVIFKGQRSRVIPKPAHTRWLSHERTVENIMDKFDALIVS